MKYIPFLLLLVSCDFMHEHIAIPDSHYKGTVILHVIENGQKKSNERGASILQGSGVKLNFNFQEVCKPVDSAIQKLYGLSDSFNHHMKNSARLGFRVRYDSTIDIFAFWHKDKIFAARYLGNVKRYDWNYGAVEIERDFYEFRLNDKILRVPRDKKTLFGPKYRLFPYYDDGEGKGATGRVAIAIEELR